MNRDIVDINVIVERNSAKYMQGNFFKKDQSWTNENNLRKLRQQ